jgi:hypothetical protein
MSHAENTNVQELVDAISALDYATIVELVKNNGHAIWTGKHLSKCMCGCVETDIPIKMLFFMASGDDESIRTHNANKLVLIQKLIDSKVLLCETLTDDFIMGEFSHIYGWDDCIKKIELLLKNLTPERIQKMRDEHDQTPILAVMIGHSSQQQCTKLVTQLMEIGVDFAHARNDGLTPFMHACFDLNLELIEKFRTSATTPINPNQLYNCQDYVNDELVDNYISILHRILPMYATNKDLAILADMRKVLKILFEMGIDIKYKSSRQHIFVYSYIISYGWIDFLPITANEFWTLIGLDKDKNNGGMYALHEQYTYSCDTIKLSHSNGNVADDLQMINLIKYLHARKYKKDYKTIQKTISYLKETLALFPVNYLKSISPDIGYSTHSLYGYQNLPEIMAYFE